MTEKTYKKPPRKDQRPPAPAADYRPPVRTPPPPRLFRVTCPRCEQDFKLPYQPDKVPVCPECFERGYALHLARGFGKGRAEEKTTLKVVHVKCTLCGKEDDIPFHIRDPQKVMCNACYDKTHGIWRVHTLSSPEDEFGEQLALKFLCSKCESTGFLPVKDSETANQIANEAPKLLCRQCLKQERFEQREAIKASRTDRGDGVVVIRRKREA